MAAVPYMPFFFDAYALDAGHLTEPEHGCYLRLMSLAWTKPECRLPNDDQWLARHLQRSVEFVREHYRPIIAEFFQTDGNWVWQKRQQAEWRRAHQRHQKQSDNAKSRWNKEKPSCRGNAVAMPTTPTSTTRLKKESPNGLSKESPPALPAVRDEPAGFVAWYARYPRKVGRDAAVKAYRAALAKADADELLDGLDRARATWERNGTEARYIPHPATWLNRRGWADEDFQAGDGTVDPIGAAHRMTLDTIRKMKTHGFAEEFPGTHSIVPDGPAPSVWGRPEDDAGALVLAEWPVH